MLQILRLRARAFSISLSQYGEHGCYVLRGWHVFPTQFIGHGHGIAPCPDPTHPRSELRNFMEVNDKGFSAEKHNTARGYRWAGHAP